MRTRTTRDGTMSISSRSIINKRCLGKTRRPSKFIDIAANPLAGVDIEKEYDLILKKKSKLSYVARRKIISIINEDR